MICTYQATSKFGRQKQRETTLSALTLRPSEPRRTAERAGRDLVRRATCCDRLVGKCENNSPQPQSHCCHRGVRCRREGAANTLVIGISQTVVVVSLYFHTKICHSFLHFQVKDENEQLFRSNLTHPSQFTQIVEFLGSGPKPSLYTFQTN